MEPTNLKPPSPPDDQIEAWLRTSSQLPPLPDDGFSARVVAALPARRQNRRAWLCVAGAVVGVVIAALGGAFSTEVFTQWQASSAEIGRLLLDPMLFTALVIAALSAFYALKSDELRQYF
jgi:hypothetical protein